MAFPTVLAILPLGAYLVMLGFIRLRGQVLVTTGGRDTFALSLAIAGLVAIGPGELFFPAAAGATFGPAVWPVLAMLYFLLVLLWVLYQRPRLVVYGLGDAALAGPLLRACQTIDPDSWLDDRAGTIAIPGTGLHLRMIRHRGGESVDVESFETDVPPELWRSLLTRLRREVASETVVPSTQGGVLALLGLTLLGWATLQLVLNPTEVAEGLRDWLWR